jgi:hypothetical protein
MDESKQSALQPPFSKDQLRDAILDIFLLHIRISHLFASSENLLKAFGTKSRSEDGPHLWTPDLTPADFGLTHADVADTEFAKGLEQEYDFGFFGIIGPGEPMHYETMHTWIALYLTDLERSQTVAEWEGYGAGIADSIRICLHTCELANARSTLERSAFASFQRLDEPGHDPEEHSLTIHQMALLAGMEEMSIRTAASRKGPQPLETIKVDRRTLIEPAVAKAWLVAKGKYVAVRHVRPQLDISGQTFSTLADLREALVYHSRELKETESSIEAINELTDDRAHIIQPKLARSARNRALCRELAATLHLDADALHDAAMATALIEELSEVQNTRRIKAQSEEKAK